jgi:hypothetical protein
MLLFSLFANKQKIECDWMVVTSVFSSANKVFFSQPRTQVPSHKGVPLGVLDYPFYPQTGVTDKTGNREHPYEKAPG